MIEEANARSERTEECWPIAELLRVKGELLLLQGAPGAAAVAEDHFRQALDWARRPGEARGGGQFPGEGTLAIRAVPLMPWPSSSRPTTGSPRASKRPTSKPQKRFSTLSKSGGSTSGFGASRPLPRVPAKVR